MIDLERLAELVAEYGQLRELEGAADKRQRDGLAARSARTEASRLYGLIVLQLRALA